ncbi:protein DsrB [Klebsiella variicola]|nr:protein DsrB [Klebsiella variicola]
MQVNDRVTVKTDGGPRRSGVVLAIESFSEGTMYLVSLEDYPLGIWFFNEIGHPDGIFVEKEASENGTGGTTASLFQRRFT